MARQRIGFYIVIERPAGYILYVGCRRYVLVSDTAPLPDDCARLNLVVCRFFTFSFLHDALHLRDSGWLACP